MNVATLRKERSSKDGVNWVTAIFMALFHIGAIAALFFLYLESIFRGDFSVVDVGKSWASGCATTAC